MKKSTYIILFFSILLNYSCATDDTCTQTKYVKLIAGFYHVNDTTHVTSALSLDSLSIQGLKYDTLTNKYHLVDSLLYKKQTGTGLIYLPLDNLATRTAFQFKFNTVIDTITIFHSKNLNDFLSLECGCIVTHAIDTVIMTKHYIDSVQIKIHEVNTTNGENIRLYK